MRGLLAAGAFLLSACASSQAQEGVPAVITNPTTESRAELLRAVSDALGGAAVTLADDALTSASSLTIDRTAARDAAGRRLNGRELGRPEQFHLLKQGNQCVLVHENSGKRQVLVSARCQPEA
jgi:hypothetical protein